MKNIILGLYILLVTNIVYGQPEEFSKDSHQFEIKFDDGHINKYKITMDDDIHDIRMNGDFVEVDLSEGDNFDVDVYFFENEKLILLYNMNVDGLENKKYKYYDSPDVDVSMCCYDNMNNKVNDDKTKKLYDYYLSMKYYSNKKLTDISNEDAFYLTELGRKKVTEVNNLGFALYKAGIYEQAGIIFQGLLYEHPERVVLYLNLADNLWAETYNGPGRKEQAIPLYKKYIELMIQKNKKSLIPQYVFDRIKK